MDEVEGNAQDKVMVVAVPSEMLTQLVQNNTDLTRCITRLMEYIPAQKMRCDYDLDVAGEVQQRFCHNDDDEDDDSANAAAAASPPRSSVIDIIGAVINAFLIAVVIMWFLECMKI
jgi:hypothetical protein